MSRSNVWAAALPAILLQRVEAAKYPDRVHLPRYMNVTNSSASELIFSSSASATVTSDGFRAFLTSTRLEIDETRTIESSLSADIGVLLPSSSVDTSDQNSPSSAKIVSLNESVVPSEIKSGPYNSTQHVSGKSLQPNNTMILATLDNWNTTATINISTITTCPLSYPSDYPRTGFPKNVVTDRCWPMSYGAEQLYFGYGDNCLAKWCYTGWDNSIASFAAATKLPNETITSSRYAWAWGTKNGSTYIASEWISTTVFTRLPYMREIVHPASPCCGHCRVSARNINLIIWPDMTSYDRNNTRPHPTARGTYVDEFGFTFISPSVYVALTSFQASNWCEPIAQIPYTTITLNPSDISTMDWFSKPYLCPSEDIPTVPNEVHPMT
ncbi:hypothetical protein IQ07DRAFT_57874 [Pyrenochaeta sp. DS3sAY3a]|nr:hypothetical protein IQ07DRAFT_57874 [Pyrenochaeta sp. DS3sAY3a]